MLGCPALSIYRSLLGESEASLAPQVARLHTTARGARGVFRVRRGQGPLARLIAWVLRMPPARERSVIELTVTRGERGERWSRSFDGRPLWTDQWADGPLLVEQMGLVQCTFRLRADGRSLVFEQAGARLGLRGFSLPLPRFLSPFIAGRAGAQGEQVLVDVQISAPLAGLLVAYDGAVTPE